MKRILLAFLTPFLFLILANSQAQTIYLVDVAKAGNINATGVTSVNAAAWTNACGDLQTAINAAATGDQVWVKSGTYKPSRDPFGSTSPANNRDKTFSLKSGVKVYGGFSGAETSLSQRNSKTNITILSGDLGTAGDNTDNSYHVVLSVSDANTTLLDGFTITGGNANAGSFVTVETKSISRSSGGGILVESGTIQLTNITVTGNYGVYGGGMSLSGSPISLLNTVVHGNNAYDGGGMICSGSSASFTNCILSGNTAVHDGGGIHIFEGVPVFTNVTISGNTGVNGGGININSSNTVITNSIIWGNNGTTAGLNVQSGVPVVTSSIIQGGYPGNSGSNPVFENNYSLTPCSPAINAGNNNSVPSGIVTDIAGNARVSGGTVDIGAFEFTIPNTITPDANGVVYVKAGCNGNGSSWGNAVGDLQSAINAVGVSQVWVTAGTYKPNRRADATGTITPNDRDNAFVMKEGVKLYGGFAGNETGLISRNWIANTTILSGDIGTINSPYDNCYHVVLMVGSSTVPITAATALDGFTITGGYGLGAGYNTSVDINGHYATRGKGGGLYAYTCSAIMSNLAITGNESDIEGGGIYASYSSFTLSNASVSNNKGGTGGGLSNDHSSPVLSNVTISNNNATSGGGGGIYNSNSSPTLNNAMINSNITTYRGGGIYNNTNSSPKLTGGSITNNTAVYGGGIASYYNSSPVFTNITISGNFAYAQGGGLWNNTNSFPVVTRCTISGNAASQGGGMYNEMLYISNINLPRDAVVKSTLFSGNTAGVGGAIYNYYVENFLITNCTISGNNANGGGIYNNNYNYFSVNNTIIYGNSSGIGNMSYLTFNNCQVQGAGGIDPLFVNAPDFSTAPFTNGNYRLKSCSPVINTGNNGFLGAGDTLDLAGNNRRYNNGQVDLGAYELQRVPANSIFTDVHFACDSFTWINGVTYTSSNNTATYTIPASDGCDSTIALNLTIVPTTGIDIITAINSYTWIDGITYTSSNNSATYTLTNSLGCDSVVTLNLTITSTATKYVKEGATGNGSSWANASGDLQYMINSTSSGGEIWVAAGTYVPNRKVDATATITPGNRDNAFVLKKGVKVYGGFAGNETTLAQRNFYENTSILSGNLGDVNNINDNAYHVVVCAGNIDSAALSGFTIKDGNANGDGNTSVNGESLSRGNGGGISILNASPQLSNLTVIGNKSSVSGGGISIFFSSPTITNCIVTGNEAGSDGGGIYITFSPMNITNTVISGNKSGPGSGIFAFYSTPLNLVNVTISGNTNYGMANFNTDPQVKNSIIYGNGNGGINGGNPTYFNSLVQGLTSTSNGNISGSIDPLFIDAPSHTIAPFSNGNYHLQSCSPVSGKGNNSYVSTVITDLDGYQRIYNNGTVDLGAYEYQGIISLPVAPVAQAQEVLLGATVADLVATGNNLKWYNVPANGIPLPPLTVLTTGTYYVSQTPDGYTCESFRTQVLVTIVVPVRYVKPVASGAGDGSSWSNASGDLQAMVSAPGSRQIWVAAGTYKPVHKADNFSVTNPADRDNAFVMKKSVKIYGGFNGTETLLEQRNPKANICILSGDLGNIGDLSDNAYHVVISAGNSDSAALDGFTIKDGNANGSGNISVNGESLSRGNGGGISILNASPQLSNLTVIGNKASVSGGGISIFFSSPTITNCIVAGNESGPDGGGIYITFSPMNITNTVISGNKSGPGSGIFAFYSTPLNLVNVTISGNTNYGMVNFNTDPQVKNSIIYGNGDGGINGGNPAYFNSLVQGLTNTANSNISGAQDPGFTNAPSYTTAPFTGGNYRLQPCSPAINAGNNSYLAANNTTDVAGRPRKHANGQVDMGAYENALFNLPDVAATTLSNNNSCTAGDGWIHFYNDTQEKILLSIHPHGQDLGNIHVTTVLNSNYDIAASSLQAPFGQVKSFIPFNRSWSVEAANVFNNPVSVRFYFSGTDSADIASARAFGNVQDLTLYKVSGTNAWDGNASGYKGYSYNPTPDTAHFSLGTYDGIQYAEFQVQSFSAGTMALSVDEAVLPLDLLSFTAAPVEGKTYLQWLTVNEENVSHFEIERSGDARSWQAIHNQPALNGIKQEYDIWDESPLTGTNYYRLKMNDLDGTYKYSKIVEVSFGQDAHTLHYLIYPNPNNGDFYVFVKGVLSQETQMFLFDGLGRLVHNQLLQEGNNLVSTNNSLVSGMYYLKIEDKKGSYSYKVIIE